MQTIHRRDLIIRAVRSGDRTRIDQLVERLADAERALQILHAKGYGATGMTASATAAQVPNYTKP
jgi:molybdate-binding protein